MPVRPSLLRARRAVSVVLAALIAATVFAAGAGRAAALAGQTELPEGFGNIVVNESLRHVYVSSPLSNTVSVLDFNGTLLKVIDDEPGAFGMALVGQTLYVALSTGGSVDAIDTISLARTKRLAPEQLIRPRSVVFAADRLWTTSGGDTSQQGLIAIDPETGAVSRYPHSMIRYANTLVGSPADPNILYGWELGISPATLLKWDLTTEPPSVNTSYRTDMSNLQDLSVSPDGARLFPASGAPYEIWEHRASDLKPSGNIYVTTAYPNATAVSPGKGGLVAAGSYSVYGNDVFVFQIGNPARRILVHDFGQPAGDLFPQGLAMPADASRVFAVLRARTPGTDNAVVLHVLPLEDSSVSSMGFNGFGALGTGGLADAIAPRQAAALSGSLDVSAGLMHSLAAKRDGSVWAWGNNAVGQLGTGNTLERLSPVRVAGISGAAGVSAGFLHSVAVTKDGSVWTWGWNGFGQLGTGTTIDQLAPARVPGLSNVVAVSAGAYHSLALKADGTVWAWGWNAFGQLGDGTTTTRPSPVQVSGIDSATAIAGGGFHSLASLDGEGVAAWGWNALGQLGDGSFDDALEPVEVSGIEASAEVAAGYAHSHSVTEEGVLQSWGWNALGQLGDGSAVDRPEPVTVATNGPVRAVSGGLLHSAADIDGRAWAWGWNQYGQLGDGTVITRLVPTITMLGREVFGVAAGAFHSVIVRWS